MLKEIMYGRAAYENIRQATLFDRGTRKKHNS